MDGLGIPLPGQFLGSSPGSASWASYSPNKRESDPGGYPGDPLQNPHGDPPENLLGDPLEDPPMVFPRGSTQRGIPLGIPYRIPLGNPSGDPSGGPAAAAAAGRRKQKTLSNFGCGETTDPETVNPLGLWYTGEASSEVYGEATGEPNPPTLLASSV